jgi:hypothetical protein
MRIQIIKCGAPLFEEVAVNALLASVVMLNDAVDSIGGQYLSSARRWLRGVKYHGRGGPWLRRGLWHEASGTTGGECNSARAHLGETCVEPIPPEHTESATVTEGVCCCRSGVCPWASAPSRGRDTGPAHRVLSQSRCAGFARPITWVPNHNSASRHIRRGTQPSGRASPPPTVGRGTCAAFRLEKVSIETAHTASIVQEFLQFPVEAGSVTSRFCSLHQC